MILKLLSTIRQVTFEDANGVVLGAIVRKGDELKGKEKLVGKIPTRPYFRAVHYFDGRIDRSMHTPQTVPAPALALRP